MAVSYKMEPFRAHKQQIMLVSYSGGTKSLPRKSPATIARRLTLVICSVGDINRSAAAKQSVSAKQERPMIEPDDLPEFDKGEFIGYTVEAKQGRFWGKIALDTDENPVRPLPKSSSQHDLQTNMDSIILDCATILGLNDKAVTNLLSVENIN